MTESNRYITAIAKGDEKVISEIYKKFYIKIRGYVLANKGKAEDAEDVFHDALMYLIVANKRTPLKITSFEGYFYTICKNIWRTSLKNKNKRVINEQFVPLEDKETNVSLFILEQERRDLYTNSFHKLSDNCKEILSNYFNGMSYDELLSELNYSSINTVRQRVFKCKTKLISLIKNDDRYKKLV